VVLAQARAPAVRAAMQLAWEAVMAKPRPRTLARSKPGPRSSASRARPAPRRTPPGR
jgi:hypothetical protein